MRNTLSRNLGSVVEASWEMSASPTRPQPTRQTISFAPQLPTMAMLNPLLAISIDQYDEVVRDFLTLAGTRESPHVDLQRFRNVT